VRPAGRAAHVTAKATPSELEPKRSGGCGGVGGAARVQGVERNTRGPSARPVSGQASSYKPKAKSSRAHRKSEGSVVPDGLARPEPTKAVRHNAADGRMRPLGIPTVRDRVVQMAAKLVLEPIFEADFARQGRQPPPPRMIALAARALEGVVGQARLAEAQVMRGEPLGLPHGDVTAGGRR
jgi:hypothetical protein